MLHRSLTLLAPSPVRRSTRPAQLRTSGGQSPLRAEAVECPVSLDELLPSVLLWKFSAIVTELKCLERQRSGEARSKVLFEVL
ncbi:MAG TPA: hypothetical protein DEG43_15910, partial [Acidimicrobiaceae bacterium]|nr:hypothetical protein [Acidimicrobiaceae bacterium]